MEYINTPRSTRRFRALSRRLRNRGNEQRSRGRPLNINLNVYITYFSEQPSPQPILPPSPPLIIIRSPSPPTQILPSCPLLLLGGFFFPRGRKGKCITHFPGKAGELATPGTPRQVVQCRVYPLKPLLCEPSQSQRKPSRNHHKGHDIRSVIE